MRHWWKWFLGILSVLILIIVGGAWYLSNNWKPIIEAKLKEIIHNSSEGLYTLKYSDMDINVGLGNISLDSVELIPDTAVYSKLLQEKKAPNNRFHIKLESLRIKHFSLTDIFFNRKLYVSSVLLHGPDIHMIHEYHKYNDTISKYPKKSFYDHIKSVFKSITVKNVSVDSAQFKYSTVVGRSISSIGVKKMIIKVEDILIDSTSLNDKSRIFYTKNIDVKVPRFVYYLPTGFYKVGFDNLHFSTKDKNLSLNNVIFNPTVSRDRFFKLKGKNVAISDLKFNHISMSGLDFQRLVEKQQIIGNILNINNGTTAFYQNLAYPLDFSNKIGKAPYQQMMKLKNTFYFNRVNVNNVTVLYSERSAKFDKYGVITFNGTTGNLTNVTNSIAILQKNKFMRADLTTKVMNAGKLHVKFGFDMLSKYGSYTYVGSLTPMKATAFNQILGPLVNVEIASGNIKKISFDMQGTDYKNWGVFKFNYDSLKVNVLHLAKDGQAVGSKKALSYIVNRIFVNDSNPDHKGVDHVGMVEYTRVPEFPFFKTMWQSLLQGIIQCVGISPEQEAKMMGIAAKSGKVVTEVKKIAKGTGNVAKAVGHEIGKDASKAYHGTEHFFKNLFKKKHKE